MRHSPKSKTEDLFTRASKEAEAGKLRVAFRLYLAAAKAGDTSCQINLGISTTKAQVFGEIGRRRCIGTNVLIGAAILALLTTLESCGEMTGSTDEHCIGSSERSGLAIMKLI